MRGQPWEIGERAFAFAVRVVKLCRSLEKKPGVSRTLANQLLRSGTSVGANLEESKGGQSRADYLSKVSIALKEARETHYWLRLFVASKIIAEENMEPLLDECNGDSYDNREETEGGERQMRTENLEEKKGD